MYVIPVVLPSSTDSDKHQIVHDSVTENKTDQQLKYIRSNFTEKYRQNSPSTPFSGF